MKMCARSVVGQEISVKTNIGLVPLDDYLDIKATSFGYNSYEEMRKYGMDINIETSDLLEEIDGKMTMI